MPKLFSRQKKWFVSLKRLHKMKRTSRNPRQRDRQKKQKTGNIDSWNGNKLRKERKRPDWERKSRKRRERSCYEKGRNWKNGNLNLVEKINQASLLCSFFYRFTIGPPAKRHFAMAFRWRTDGGPLLHVYCEDGKEKQRCTSLFLIHINPFIYT